VNFLKELTTKEIFENVLKELSDDYLLLNQQDSYKSTDELIYGIRLNKGNPNEKKFIIFSSISIYNHKFRGYGSDAIRILRWNNGKPNGKSIRVNRTPNWATNLKKKVMNFKFNNEFENAYLNTKSSS